MGGAQQGFTLTEVAIVCAIVGILATIALPSWRARELQAGRLDAVDALTRLQTAQERHRADHGLYAPQLSALRIAPNSPQGRYALALELTGPEAYRASARARDDGPQAADRDCAALTLEVRSGFAQAGPSARCWNR
ncbi:MAG: prepilin-type N-terminal cleavage/methylation domain-containing protein [Rubrivivax sp.]|nr:prepilin-type N-terminal cleavage/methylation domain-containing protein [Rubrivivax sp.]